MNRFTDRKIKSNILVDTGFWFALFPQKDGQKESTRYEIANKLLSKLEFANVYIPYPTLYETINTAFAENKKAMLNFRKLLERPHFIKICDYDYRPEDTLNTTFDEASRNKSKSFVDMMLINILSDDKLKIDYLFTFNRKDFTEICYKKGSRSIHIIDNDNILK